jgi:hypothetical protein
MKTTDQNVRGLVTINIETISDQSIPDDELPDVKLGNLKDPDKIKAKTEEAKEKMSLRPLTGIIVVGGFKRDNEDVEMFVGEAGTLVGYSELCSDPRGVPLLVTYNGRAFDLPFLAMTYLRHNVRFPFLPAMHETRYKHDRHLDVYDFLTQYGAMMGGVLAEWGARLGVKPKVWGRGSQVAEWHRAGDMESIVRHCASNIEVTHSIGQRICDVF